MKFDTDKGELNPFTKAILDLGKQRQEEPLQMLLSAGEIYCLSFLGLDFTPEFFKLAQDELLKDYTLQYNIAKKEGLIT